MSPLSRIQDPHHKTGELANELNKESDQNCLSQGIPDNLVAWYQLVTTVELDLLECCQHAAHEGHLQQGQERSMACHPEGQPMAPAQRLLLILQTVEKMGLRLLKMKQPMNFEQVDVSLTGDG
ncbi:hypothetical protein E2320_004592 [Naja naja]|nr:hypothetical protein E2320_004592 [Naja naja]